MIQNAQTDAERKYCITQEMNTLHSAFFTQAQFARFQQTSMKTLERGETLTAGLRLLRRFVLLYNRKDDNEREA